jgi:hypothetical protein
VQTNTLLDRTKKKRDKVKNVRLDVCQRQGNTIMPMCTAGLIFNVSNRLKCKTTRHDNKSCLSASEVVLIRDVGGDEQFVGTRRHARRRCRHIDTSVRCIECAQTLNTNSTGRERELPSVNKVMAGQMPTVIEIPTPGVCDKVKTQRLRMTLSHNRTQ